MPTYDFITELLELEDIILKDFSFTVTEIHISFSLKRKPTVCPCCGFITEQVADLLIFCHDVIYNVILLGRCLIILNDDNNVLKADASAVDFLDV